MLRRSRIVRIRSARAGTLLAAVILGAAAHAAAGVGVTWFGNTPCVGVPEQ
jgi:hypothetical protein